MPTPLHFGTDNRGTSAYAPDPSTTIYNATITNGNETHITVPSTVSQWVVAFAYQPGTDVWVDFSGATAAVPVGATLVAATSELNPGARSVYSGSKISMITDSTSADVSVSFYAIAYT